MLSRWSRPFSVCFRVHDLFVELTPWSETIHFNFCFKCPGLVLNTGLFKTSFSLENCLCLQVWRSVSRNHRVMYQPRCRVRKLWNHRSQHFHKNLWLVLQIHWEKHLQRCLWWVFHIHRETCIGGTDNQPTGVLFWKTTSEAILVPYADWTVCLNGLFPVVVVLKDMLWLPHSLLWHL